MTSCYTRRLTPATLKLLTPPAMPGIFSLSLTRCRRRWKISAASLGSNFSGYNHRGAVRTERRRFAAEKGAVGPSGDGEGGKEVDRRVEVAVAVGATVVLGVGNRVLHKLALIPLKHHPFFLAQLATFGYVVVYFTILYMRHHAGIVTHQMLCMPKAPFLLVGFLQAVATATGMAAAAMLPGASIPILSQTFLVWQILLSTIFLGRRYRVSQLLGCLLVTETIFLDSCQQLKGCSVDLFVVNSYGSAYQALFICFLSPFMSKLWGVPFSQLPSYLKDGAACFLNIGGSISGCDGAPLLPLLFVIINMGFNISLLHLLKISSAVVSSLASTFSVPIAVFMFTLPLPYLEVGSALPAGFVAGAIILFAGLLVYAWTPTSSRDSASFASSG